MNFDPKMILDGGALVLLACVLAYIARVGNRLVERAVASFDELRITMRALSDTLSKIQMETYAHFSKDDVIHAEVARQLREIQSRLETGLLSRANGHMKEDL